ncbi:hypothetical protein FOL47_005026 [Perkinsus chesapeaki]|uniref:Uncharacterized protein n=1 Tax=Perkinsus chesapeaki TaxID=330153 RepID=A0A7J6LZF1_PERCH|nr:hypothetical protein FOL47_005026 [Perkinsus chesapeaki]
MLFIRSALIPLLICLQVKAIPDRVFEGTLNHEVLVSRNVEIRYHIHFYTSEGVNYADFGLTTFNPWSDEQLPSLIARRLRYTEQRSGDASTVTFDWSQASSDRARMASRLDDIFRHLPYRPLPFQRPYVDRDTLFPFMTYHYGSEFGDMYLNEEPGAGTNLFPIAAAYAAQIICSFFGPKRPF